MHDYVFQTLLLGGNKVYLSIYLYSINTSKTERRSKIVINKVFNCRLSPDRRQILFLTICDPRSSIVQSVFDCRLSDMIKERI